MQKNNQKLGATQEEQQAYYIFYQILQTAKNRGITNPNIIYLSYNEELQSFIMWFALRCGLKIKHTEDASYADRV